MLCVCHGEPCYWQKDKRRHDGGWWECGVKRRERQRRVHAEKRDRILQQRRDRYDQDWVYRLELLMRQAAKRRRQRLDRRREATVG